MRRRTRLAAFVAGAAVVGLALMGLVAGVPAGTASSSAVMAGSATYNDPIGDSQTAPDIGSVVVSNDDARMVSIAITFANRTALGGTDWVDVEFDTDLDADTGTSGGTEYIIAFFRGEARLGRFDEDEDEWVDAPMETVTAAWAGSTLTLKVSTREIGSPTQFRFALWADANIADLHAPYDEAPDEDTPSWVYQVKLAAPTLTVKSLDCTPEPARAGKLMTGKAVVALTRAGVPEVLSPTAKVTWRATFGNVKLRPLSTTRVGGTLRSTWKLPRTVKAKVVRITLTITSDGVTVTKTHLHRVVR